MSTATPTVDQIEEVLSETPKYMQLLNEQQRYKQQCRLRSIDFAFSEKREGILKIDVIERAKEYYDWLIDIAPQL